MSELKEVSCLSLESSRWLELEHAYGNASDIPNLISQLESIPSLENDKEPWFSLWSSLAHQNDVFSASFATVPHVIRLLSKAPLTADFSYFQFPAVVEICRQKNQIIIPDDLKADYFESLRLLPKLVAKAADRDWDISLLLSVLSSIAASKGFVDVAEAVQEMTPDVTSELMEWVDSR